MRPDAAVYMFFNQEDQIIYIGVSQNPYQREREHKKTSAWFEHVARMEIQWCTTREKALKIEKARIRHYRPRFNTMHNKIGQK